MFTKEKPKRRELLSKDKRIAIAEYIIDYVRRNPGRQIPTAKIGEQCNTPAYNISTIIKQLVRMGELKQISRYTYVISVGPKPQEQLPMQVVSEKQNIATQVEALAKDYMWAENGSGTLKGFIDWLKS